MSIAKNAAVSHFYKLARKYCHLVESPPTSRKTFLRTSAKLLPELLAAAIRLPAGRNSRRLDRELSLIWNDIHHAESLNPAQQARAQTSKYRDTVVPTAQFFVVARRLARRLREYDGYSQVFDPYHDSVCMKHSLSNDLAEIWHDVKPALLLFEIGSEAAMRHAVRTWAVEVRMHWGANHYPSALKAILFALREVDIDWEFRLPRRRRKREHDRA